MVSNWIDAYEDYLKTEKQASANTVSSYLRDVRQFASAMEEQEHSLAQVTPLEVEGYIRRLTVLGKSPATVTRSLASIKSFYHYLLLQGEVSGNPARSAGRWNCSWLSRSPPMPRAAGTGLCWSCSMPPVSGSAS